MITRLQKLLWKNLPWIFILLGVTFILIGLIPNENLDDLPLIGKIDIIKLPDAFKSIGTAILGGGIFAAVLKSFQFIGIFQQELAKVVYSREYLEKQSKIYLEETWTRVSQAMFTNKFPAINHPIESSILKTYFPSDHNYYYRDIHHEYKDFILEEIDNKTYITYTHDLEGKIIPLEKKGEFLWSVEYSAIVDEHSFRNIELLKISHNNQLFKDLKEDMEEQLKRKEKEYTSDIYEVKLKHQTNIVSRKKKNGDFALIYHLMSYFYSRRLRLRIE